MNYHEDIQKILTYRDVISGTHKLKNTELFINGQLNERRKRAAKNLIDNTHYVTFNKVFEYIRDVIKQIYSEIDSSRKLYLYVGDKKKSSYFISLIALHFITIYGYKFPELIYDLSEENMDLIGEDVLIYMDDFAYSGSQMGNMLSHIYYDRFLLGEKSLPEFHVGLVGATTHAQRLLSEVRYDYHDTVITKKLMEKYAEIVDSHSTPFHIHYGFIVKSLYEVLSEDDFLDLLYYFSPLTDATPIVSLYFDHKIADPVSTFTIALQYGPILPAELYDYDFDSVLFSLKTTVHLFNKEEKYSETYWSFNESYNEHLDEYLENIQNEDKLEDKDGKLILSMLLCNYELDIDDIPYFVFIMPVFVLEQWVSDDIYMYANIIKQIDDPANRCPKSFYKLDFF